MCVRRVGFERKRSRLEERRLNSSLLLVVVELVVKVEEKRGEVNWQLDDLLLSCIMSCV